MSNSTNTALVSTLRRLTGLSLAVSTLLVAAQGCGSSDPIDGPRVICDAGRAEACACADGSTGSQVCADNGAKFGVCECAGGAGGAGASGGSGGVGGTAGNGGSAGSGGSAGVGASGGASQGGAGGSAGVAGAGAGGPGGMSTGGSGGSAGVGSEDDPCVAGSYRFNCSDSCQDQSECPGACRADSFTLTTDATYRLPNQPGRAPGCMCPAVPFVITGTTGLAVWDYRIRVAPPWKLRNAEGELNKTFCAPETGSNCITVGSAENFLVYTEDPDAPARNLIAERITPDQTCH